ncbi:SCY1-like protein 2 [Caerostris extrusa]|uniref:SCY1-like protein 2 n=1 Tax=Caerostris extrusa TaxID=172846 RepID=A0AAV4QJS1_CAEEX|nr:SCY1-like protein 2 [Caerostris extrusa]
MLGEKRYGLTVNLLATRVMPGLIPIAVCPGLKLDQFASLVKLLRDMLDHVARNQRNKLKLEKLSSTEIIPTTFSAIAEQSASYPHRPPTLRLESRRQSISVDDVARRSSGANGVQHYVYKIGYFEIVAKKPKRNILMHYNSLLSIDVDIN